MGLDVVLNQWGRVVFMQTNREDLGDRYREILLPYPFARKGADRVSSYVKEYYQQLAALREKYERRCRQER